MEEQYNWLKTNLADKGYTPKRILDLGAWNGFWTKNCKTFWPDSYYTCIEAGPKHEQFLKNISNEYHIALLGDKHREVDVYINKVGYTKGASIFPSNNKKIDKRQMVTLESVVGNQRYDFIKQDVQGSELLIMKGSEDIFKKADYILNEVNIKKVNDLPSLEEMTNYMKTIGFTYHKIIAEHVCEPKQVDVLYSKKII